MRKKCSIVSALLACFICLMLFSSCGASDNPMDSSTPEVSEVSIPEVPEGNTPKVPEVSIPKEPIADEVLTTLPQTTSKSPANSDVIPPASIKPESTTPISPPTSKPTAPEPPLPPTSASPEQGEIEESTSNMINITIGSNKFTATLADNPSVAAFKDMLPMTVQMGDLNSNEKYYYLSDGLPTNSRSGGNIQNGDIMLYGSDCLVLFYESFSSSYSYTRLGTVDNPSGLKTALGAGSVTVTWSLAE